MHFVMELNLHKMLTVDKMIILYNGHFCGIHHFLCNKPIRFDINFLAMLDLLSKYVTHVVIYEEKGTNVDDEGMGYEVVRNLI